MIYTYIYIHIGDRTDQATQFNEPVRIVYGEDPPKMVIRSLFSRGESQPTQATHTMKKLQSLVSNKAL